MLTAYDSPRAEGQDLPAPRTGGRSESFSDCALLELGVDSLVPSRKLASALGISLPRTSINSRSHA
jgi:hypothetical protein